MAECRTAGIRVKMITGDHAGTARAIAAQLNLENSAEAITGHDLDRMDDVALGARAREVDVYARVSPEHKLRLVTLLQAQGAIVAMTGDGVNDAPALKRADVGIAMGHKGTEAAKEASEMVIADDNFASIVHAVEQGRTVYDNLKKAIVFLLPINGGEALSIMIAVLFGFTLPITPVQILWVNMVSSVALAMALAFEATEPETMRRPPRPANEAMLSGFLLWRIALVSALMAAGVFGIFGWASTHGSTLEESRTYAVNTLVAMEVFYLFSVRYLRAPSFKLDQLFNSRAVLVAVSVVVTLQLFFTYVPFMERFFDTRPVDFVHGVEIIALGVALFMILELEKLALRKWRRKHDGSRRQSGAERGQIMTVFPDVFTEMAVLLLFAAAVGALCVRLRQPLIVAFIAVGILVGPSVLGWVSANDQVDLLAKFGITLLLFVVGLKLDLHIIRTMGPVALATGLGQVIFTSVVGYLIGYAFGMTPVTALYVAVALTFSSTIIIVKLLSDKREVDTLHGRIALGFLIVQDLVVVLVMIGLNALGATGDVSWTQAAFAVLVKGVGFILLVGVAMRYLLPRLLHMLSRSQELLVLFGIAWGLALAALGVMLGFSKEVGAFVAGVSLASTPYRDALGARLTSVRDFLLLFFFLDLGAQLDLGLLGAQLVEALVFSLFVLVGNPLIVMVIMGVLGYRSRTGFLAGLTVAQISEFSLILGALGLSLGHISAETMGLITLVGLITISASTYMIVYSHPLYERLAPWLGVFERRQPHREADAG